MVWLSVQSSETFNWPALPDLGFRSPHGEGQKMWAWERFSPEKHTLSGIRIRQIPPLMWANTSFTLCALNWCQSHQTTCLSFHFVSMFLVCRSWAYSHPSLTKQTHRHHGSLLSRLSPWPVSLRVSVRYYVLRVHVPYKGVLVFNSHKFNEEKNPSFTLFYFVYK